MSTTEGRAQKGFNVAIHPGETLWKLIEEKSLNLVRLAAETGLPPGALERIVLGLRRVTPDIARRLERGTGTPARLWLDIQANHEQANPGRR